MIPAVALAALVPIAVFEAAALTPATATASIQPEISIDLEHCPALPRDEVIRLAALELDARVLSPAAAGDHTTRVDVACAGSTVELRVSDPLTGKQLMRWLRLRAQDEAVAPRLVALAASELVITSWLELTQHRDRARADFPSDQRASGSSGPASPPPSQPSSQPSSQPPGDRPLDRVTETPARVEELRRAAQVRAERRASPEAQRADSAYLLAVGQAIGPFRGVGVGWGGGLRLGWATGRRWFGGEGLGGHAAADLDLGAAWTDVDSGLGRVGVSTWSAAPRASLKVRRGDWWLDLAAGGRVGLARLVGAPDDAIAVRGGTHIGTWAGPAAYGGVGVQWGHLVMTAGMEAGHVLRWVAGLVDSGPQVAVSGNWLAGTLAVGWGQ